MVCNAFFQEADLESKHKTFSQRIIGFYCFSVLNHSFSLETVIQIQPEFWSKIYLLFSMKSLVDCNPHKNSPGNKNGTLFNPIKENKI